MNYLGLNNCQILIILFMWVYVCDQYSTIPEVEAAKSCNRDKNTANSIKTHSKPAWSGQEEEPGFC